MVTGYAETAAPTTAESLSTTVQTNTDFDIPTLINETIGEHFLTSWNLGTANSAAARTTESAKEGVDAFVEKRPPNWP